VNMTGNIRVRTDKHYRVLFNELRNFVVKDMHEFFFLCACFGYRAGKRKPLGRNREERFWSNTISPEEFACFYAILIESSDMNFSAVVDDKAVIAVIEEYANAGMQILLEDVLADYTMDRGSDLRLDMSCSKELPKVLLAYIYEKASE